MNLTQEQLITLSSKIKEEYRLLSIEDNISERDNSSLSFVNVIPSLAEEEKKIILRDYNLLFPYKTKEIAFDSIFTLRGNIFLTDEFSFQQERKPLSSLRISQYCDWLDEKFKLYSIEDKYTAFLKTDFHSLVEKLMFLDLLRNEKELKGKPIRFYHPLVLVSSDKEKRILFTKYISIAKDIVRTQVTRLGILEKGDENEIRGIIIDE